MLTKPTITVFLFLAGVSHVAGATIFSDFETLAESEIVTNQIPGLTFTNTEVLTAGSTLNETDFPPASGVNVVGDLGGAITILFDNPATAFSAYFTYVLPLTIEAFDTGNVLVASASSAFSANDGFTGEAGSSPNELIGVLFAGGFTRVVITGDPDFGGSFVMDDLSAEVVPEPETFSLGILALSLLAVHRWMTRHHLARKHNHHV